MEPLSISDRIIDLKKKYPLPADFSKDVEIYLYKHIAITKKGASLIQTENKIDF